VPQFVTWLAGDGLRSVFAKEKFDGAHLNNQFIAA